jgi:diguanylate cyclase (GGDEF)-like protein/PAS domain S-box-containing protein
MNPRFVCEVLVCAGLASLAIHVAMQSGLPPGLALVLAGLAAVAVPTVLRLRDRAERDRRAQAFTQRLIDGIPDPLYVKNAESRYLLVNEAFARERGRPRGELVGLSSYDLAATPEIGELSAREDRDVLAGQDVHKEQHTTLPVTGEECFRIVSKRRCIDADGQAVVVGAHFYITRWKVAERELERLAHEDMLTGIANRRYFRAEAERAVRRAERHGEALSLLLVDLDHFKRVNDALGHQAGDEVLCEVVTRARGSLRAEDLPGRWGGEEFIVLLPLTGLEDALPVADRLREAVAAVPMATSAGPVSLTVSCGVAQWCPPESIEGLIARADAALYAAKHAGRNVCVGDPVPAVREVRVQA